MKRSLLALAMLAMAQLSILDSAAAAPAPDDQALAFARSYIDTSRYSALIRHQMDKGVADCVAAGAVSRERAQDRRPMLDAYLVAIGERIPSVQQDVADAMRPRFSRTELEGLTRFIRSVAGQHMLTNGQAAIADQIAAGVSPCALPSHAAPSSDEMAASIRASISPADMVQIRAFALSPTGMKFTRTMPAVMPSMFAGFRRIAQEAAAKAQLPPGGVFQ